MKNRWRWVFEVISTAERVEFYSTCRGIKTAIRTAQNLTYRDDVRLVRKECI